MIDEYEIDQDEAKRAVSKVLDSLDSIKALDR